MPAPAAARRYARALFALASEEGRVDAVRTELAALGAGDRVSLIVFDEQAEVLLESLKQALEEGKSESAMQSWDKIQGNISNTSNRIKENLQ